MAEALTLMEAAERLAPVFAEETESSSPLVPAKPKGKWMSLEHAGSVLAERITGQQPAPKKKKAEITVQEAVKQIESPPETPPELSEIRGKRFVATVMKWQRQFEMEDFIQRGVQQFEGMDDLTALTSPEFQAVYGYAQQLRAVVDAAAREEQAVWLKQCKAENDVFELERPDWSPADAKRVGAMLIDLGVTEQEMLELWHTPQPINIESPICRALAQTAVGADEPDPIHAALGSVGFDEAEIKAVKSGQVTIVLRDHRIQELVARAADAYTPTENRQAA
jgi:hypothetical protein